MQLPCHVAAASQVCGKQCAPLCGTKVDLCQGDWGQTWTVAPLIAPQTMGGLYNIAHKTIQKHGASFLSKNVSEEAQKDTHKGQLSFSTSKANLRPVINRESAGFWLPCTH